MKEVCGFLGLDDKFYKTKRECHEADLYHKIRSIEKTFSNFESTVERMLFFGQDSAETSYLFARHKEKVFDVICNAILQNREGFLKVLTDHTALEKELDELYLKSNRPWWMKVKWWK